MRDLKGAGLHSPVHVFLRQGVYELRDTLLFTPEDSGTETCPISYEAYAGEHVVIRGSRGITGWELHQDGIYRADLKAQGLEGASFHQLFYKGKRQVLARHPNLDPERPRTGGFIYIEDRGPKPPEQFIYEEGAIPFDEWGDISQAEVWTVFGYGWNFALTPIIEVDTQRRIITTRRVRRPFERQNRFFVQNVLGALDAPGEWFLDSRASTLYFHPPDGALADGEVLALVLDNLIELRGTIPYPHQYLHVGHNRPREDFALPEDAPARQPVEYLTFKGLHLECARQSAFRLTGARHCSIIGNTIANVGNVGINLGGVANAHLEVGNPRVVEAQGFSGGVGGGGQNILFNDPCEDCRVAGNDVSSVGSDGVFLYGARNVAENNHVYNSGLFDKDCACINLWGEDNVARRNELHDAPRNAVFLKGSGNIVELNNIHHTMLETCDGGAIRMCQRNLSLRGNVIRHNRITDTLGYGYPRNSRLFQAPYYSWGVYLDDFTCGTTVQGNIIARTGRGGVMIHGGSDNVVEGNIIVDAGTYQFELVPIRQDAMSGNGVVRNILVCDGEGIFTYRCTRWVDGAVSFGRNVAWTRGNPVLIDLGRGGARFESWAAWQEAGLDEGSILADPLLVDAEADDYRLQEGSPAWRLGFEEIPVGQIGCYESAERASWPLRADPELVREEPLLYEAPVRPINEDFEIDVLRRPPRHGDVAAAPKAPIVVTDEQAAGGKHSLKFVDAPGLRQVWLPRLFYALNYREGTVRFSCEFFLDGKRSPRLYVDPRQYSDTGDKEYFSGPMFHIAPDGSLVAAGKTLTRVPLDKWFRIELDMELGDDAQDTSQMILTVRGQEPQRLTAPHGSKQFRRLERIVIASLSEGESVFYIDNVTIGPVEE